MNVARPATGAHPLPSAAATAAALAALVTLATAVVVIAFGVIATQGVYGSRLAWLLGVALPLLATSTLFSWLAQRGPAGTWPGRRVRRVVLLTALSLFGIPIALALVALVISVLFVALVGLSRLF